MRVILHVDNDGYTIRTQRGNVLFGPTWSVHAINAYRVESGFIVEREEAAQPKG